MDAATNYIRTPLAHGPAGGSGTPTLPESRGAIRSSFHALFPAATPLSRDGAFPAATPAFQYPSLTPFLGALTPAVAAGSAGVRGLAPGTPVVGGVQAAGTPEMVSLTSPYLQAAAKEAVRREFMSMPGYLGEEGEKEKEKEDVDGEAGEQRVPGNDHAKAKEGVLAATAAAAEAEAAGKSEEAAAAAAAAAAVASGAAQGQGPHPFQGYNPYAQMYPGMFFMPQMHGFQMPGAMGTGGAGKDGKVEGGGAAAAAAAAAAAFAQQQQQQQQQQFMMGMGGMGGMGGPMMMMPMQAHGQQAPWFMGGGAGSAGGFGAGGVGAGGALGGTAGLGAAAMAAAAGMRGAGIGEMKKNETPEEKKTRVEAEKQELIREFKKKTREAALVRFRQKRRERRFGKLIRYDCRKVLAEKRPRVKGRFVRVQEGEEVEEEMETDPSEAVASPIEGMEVLVSGGKVGEVGSVKEAVVAATSPVVSDAQVVPGS